MYLLPFFLNSGKRKKSIFAKNFQQCIHPMRGECLHKSLWNIEALLLLTISVFGLFMFGYVYIGIVLLKCEWNNAFFFTTCAGLFVLIWVVFLQRNYFYEDEIVVLFPLRPFKRKVMIRYEDIAHVDYKSSQGIYACYEALEYVLARSDKSRQRYIKNVCYGWLGVFFPIRSKRLMLLLKFLKQKGCPIRREYDDIYSRRVAAAFGPDGEAARVPREEIDLARKREWPSRLISIAVLLLIIASVVAFWLWVETHL